MPDCIAELKRKTVLGARDRYLTLVRTENTLRFSFGFIPANDLDRYRKRLDTNYRNAFRSRDKGTADQGDQSTAQVLLTQLTRHVNPGICECDADKPRVNQTEMSYEFYRTG